MMKFSLIKLIFFKYTLEKVQHETGGKNIFMLKDSVLVTPPLTDGCINGIIRKQILGIAKTIDNLNVEEKSKK